MTHAEDALRELLHATFPGAEARVRPVTSGGANYTSALYAVTVPHRRQQLKLFGKVAIVGEKMRQIMDAEHLYSTEQFVYTKIMGVFNDLQEKHEVPDHCRFEFPKFYGCKPDVGYETVLLEDLTERGFETFDRFKSVDWKHAASSATALARFHALSFAYNKEFPEDYKTTTEKLAYKRRENIDEEAMKAWEKMIGSAVSVVIEETDRDKLMQLLTAPDTVNEFEKFKLPLSAVVLAHGDYRPSNLMFRTVDGTLETVVVDYQTVHAGCPATDLLYFVFCGTDEEFRRQHYQQLLDHYFQELTLALQRLGIDVNDVYPRATFDSEIKEMLSPALRMAVVILPIVTVEAEAAPQVAGDADFGTFAVKPNEVFVKRFNGIVRDCSRWGVI